MSVSTWSYLLDSVENGDIVVVVVALILEKNISLRLYIVYYIVISLFIHYSYTVLYLIEIDYRYPQSLSVALTESSPAKCNSRCHRPAAAPVGAVVTSPPLLSFIRPEGILLD